MKIFMHNSSSVIRPIADYSYADFIWKVKLSSLLISTFEILIDSLRDRNPLYGTYSFLVQLDLARCHDFLLDV
jgi:hypothetical protein